MKKIIAVILAVMLMAFSFSACRTREETKPENETTTPNQVRFI